MGVIEALTASAHNFGMAMDVVVGVAGAVRWKMEDGRCELRAVRCELLAVGYCSWLRLVQV